jgi:hypothetical protein
MQEKRNNMNINHQKRCFVNARVWLAGSALMLLLLPFSAAASLGGDVTSVQTDQEKMRATKHTVQTNEKYTINEITTPYGTTVREYVSPTGKVFGVAWRGPFLPDFQQIFGAYYEGFAQAAQAQRAAQPRRSRNAPLVIEQPGLVVHSGGHTRAYSGQAYIPGMLPQNVNANDIH